MECTEIFERLDKLYRILRSGSKEADEVKMWMSWAEEGEIYNAKSAYAAYKTWGQIMTDANAFYKRAIHK